MFMLLHTGKLPHSPSRWLSTLCFHSWPRQEGSCFCRTRVGSFHISGQPLFLLLRLALQDLGGQFVIVVFLYNLEMETTSYILCILVYKSAIGKMLSTALSGTSVYVTTAHRLL